MRMLAYHDEFNTFFLARTTIEDQWGIFLFSSDHVEQLFRTASMTFHTLEAAKRYMENEFPHGAWEMVEFDRTETIVSIEVTL